MLADLVHALVASPNEAADDVLLDALRLGVEPEKLLALNGLLRRRTHRGLCGVVGQYGGLPQSCQLRVLENVRVFYNALRDCARSKDPATAQAAMKLIALGRLGRLTYVLSEGLYGQDENVSRGACEAIVALARWVATESRRLQRGDPAAEQDPKVKLEREATYKQLMEERGEIEQVVARALEVNRGKFGPELLRAALLLADSHESKTFQILQTTKHGGQSPMIRRLQQTPDSEHVEAFLLAASQAGLRTHFGVTLSHVVEPPVLDALLRKTHWLKDNQLQLCMHQVNKGVWWGEAELEKDLARRDDEESSRIAEWIAASGTHDVMQDERFERLRVHLKGHLAGRLRLLRIAMRRPKGASVLVLRSLLTDPDERIVRLAAREIVRRRPADFENMLIQLMASAPDSVRRVIGRAVGQAGFEHYWSRFDRLDRATRRTAGRAMVKVLPDAVQRLERRMKSGPVEQRIKAVQMAQELGVADAVTGTLLAICQEQNPKLRSKAVALLAEIQSLPPEQLLDQVLNDNDARVRANAIEALENKNRTDLVPMLATRARSAHNRERANAIKALHRMKVGTASAQLMHMLQDDRAEHRISALWALRQIGWWQMLNEVVKLAKADENLRVRRYAMAILKGVAEALEDRKRKAG